MVNQLAFGAWLLLAVCLPLEQMAPLAQLETPIGRIVFTNVETLFLLALGLWALTLATARRWPHFPPRWLGVALVGWLAMFWLAALLAPTHQPAALRFAARTTGGVLAGWAVFDLTATNLGRWRALGRALALAGFVAASFGLVEAAAWPPALAWLAGFKVAPTRAGDLIRVSGTLGYATITAMLLELTLPLALAWWLTTSRWWVRLGLTLGLGAGLLTLALTLSRAGIVLVLVLLAGWGAYALLTRRKVWWQASFATGLALVAVVGGLAWLNPTILLRLSSETEQGWYQAAYQVPATLTMQPNAVVTTSVTLTNTGLRAWSITDPVFTLSYHLLAPAGTVVHYDGARTPLPQEVPPGAALTVWAYVVAPTTTGNYVLEWDMLQETIAWFSWKDSPTARTALLVAGPPLSPDQRALLPPAPPPPTDLRVITPTPGRAALWGAAWAMFQAHPWFGVGPDNFRLVYGQYTNPPLTAWDQGIHANNLYLEWLADTGLLGSLAWLGVMVGLVQVAAQGFQRVHRAQAPWLADYCGLLAGLAAWFAHGLLDYFFEFTPTYLGFWLLVGLLVGAHQHAPRPTEGAAPPGGQ